jgi:hypothetical protein
MRSLAFARPDGSADISWGRQPWCRGRGIGVRVEGVSVAGTHRRVVGEVAVVAEHAAEDLARRVHRNHLVHAHRSGGS